MAEGERILSQNEVDALLSAIDSGDVEVASEADRLDWKMRRRFYGALSAGPGAAGQES